MTRWAKVTWASWWVCPSLGEVGNSRPPPMCTARPATCSTTRNTAGHSTCRRPSEPSQPSKCLLFYWPQGAYTVFIESSGASCRVGSAPEGPRHCDSIGLLPPMTPNCFQPFPPFRPFSELAHRLPAVLDFTPRNPALFTWPLLNRDNWTDYYSRLWL